MLASRHAVNLLQFCISELRANPRREMRGPWPLLGLEIDGP